MEIKPSAVIIAVLCVFGLRVLVHKIFDPTIYKTRVYTVSVPKDWKKEVDESEVRFYSPAQDPDTRQPEAVFSIFSYQSTDALFIEDVMGEVLKSFEKANGHVKDHGDIILDGVIAKWVLFESTKPSLWILSFFLVDDFNRLIRVQFMTSPEKFKYYRPDFESWKDTIVFKKLF